MGQCQTVFGKCFPRGKVPPKFYGQASAPPRKTSFNEYDNYEPCKNQIKKRKNIQLGSVSMGWRSRQNCDW
jgi:hypothetical protein